MKKIFTLLLVLSSTLLIAQSTIDFENFNLSQDTFLNGSDLSGGFTSGDVFLQNNYVPDPNYPSWSGWSISNKTDITTPGFGNQYSSITGGGQGGSATYAVSFNFAPNILNLQGNAIGKVVEGMYITNGTYPYLSMRDGDGFAKQFGGEGDDPDFFLLTIRSYTNGQLSTDSVDFYLADYRFADNAQDYIVDEWTWVDLTSLGAVDSLAFQLRSSDVGAYGVNTPQYFCIDNLRVGADPLNTYSPELESAIKAFPNPANHFVNIEWNQTDNARLELYSVSGKLLLNQILEPGLNEVDLARLSTGLYISKIIDKKGDWFTQKLSVNK